MKKILRGICAAIAIAGWCLSANAAVDLSGVLYWEPPLTIDSENLLGVVSGTTGLGQGSGGYQAGLANVLLSMSAPSTSGDYQRSDWALPSGASISVVNLWHIDVPEGTATGVPNTGATTSAEGYYVSGNAEYAMAKYDGQQAGYILYYLGGQAAYIPRYSYSFWSLDNTEKYEISNFTLFNGDDGYTPVVPEPATVIAGVLLLLPFGASAVRVMRKRD